MNIHQDESYPDTALEMAEDVEAGRQSFAAKYFNGPRGEVKLTRLNVEKKKKPPSAITKKLYSRIIILSIVSILVVLTLLFFYLAGPIDGTEKDGEN